MTQWRLDDEVRVGPITLRGRVYLPAHQPGLAEGGRVSDRYIAYHRQRAKAGVAMQVTGATPVAPSVEWADICLWNIDESVVPGYRRLAEAVHAEGGRMLAQLAHPGPTEYEGVEVIGASLDLSEVTRQIAVPATAAQLARIIDDYAAAADRCRRGDLDGVEISMAHGLLLASFLSPLTNRRDDEFGGDAERRLELPRRVLRAVRETLGHDRVLGIRLGCDDLVAGGLAPGDAARIAAALEPQVDYISVMVGNNNRLEARVRHWPPTPAPEGLFRGVARTIREAVDVPVAAVGRIKTLDLANDIVTAGDADLVGIVRAHIADPELIAKTRAGRTADIRPCVGVNHCTNGLLAGRPLGCMVNPDAGDPASTSAVPASTLVGHTATVIGAGPAGLESARRLAERGGHVTLLESADHLGGALTGWASAPSRHEVRDLVDWYSRRLDALGVDVRLRVAATPELVAELRAEDVIVATGSTPRPLPLETDDGSVPLLDVRQAFDRPPGGRVVVFDEVGALDAAFVAEHLQERGADPVLVTARVHVGEGEGITSLYPMLRTLGDRRIRTLERLRPVAVADGHVRLTGVFGVDDVTLPADSLVWWTGGAPATGLHDAIGGAHLIGDALRPRRVADALGDAKTLVDAIEARVTASA